MELRVAIRIFDGREQKHLSHILALSSKRGEVPMLSVPAAEADVIFIKRDEPGASVFLQPGRKGKLPIAVLYDDAPDGHEWFLQQPATSNDLIPLLHALQHAVETTPRTAPEDAVPETPRYIDDRLMPPAEGRLVPTLSGQALLESLKTCLDEARVLSVQLDMNSYLVMDGRRKVVYVPTRYMEMQQTLLDILVMFRDSDYVELNEAELERLSSQTRMSTVPMEQFTWMACHHVEPQLPIPDCLAHLAFRLKRWPSFTRLSYKPVHMQWAGRLVKTAHSISHLASGAMHDMADAAKFYNACVVGGLALFEALEHPANLPLPHPVQSEKKGIMHRILKRLMK